MAETQGVIEFKEPEFEVLAQVLQISFLSKSPAEKYSAMANICHM